MTATMLYVTYKTNAPSTSPSTYRVFLREAQEGEVVTGVLSKDGPTYNDKAFYSGVFASREAATKALAKFRAISRFGK